MNPSYASHTRPVPEHGQGESVSIAARLRPPAPAVSISLALGGKAKTTGTTGHGSDGDAPAVGGRIVRRGDHAFHVTIPAAARGAHPVAHITVTRGEQIVGNGALELFSDTYMASRRFATTFREHASKPIGKVGDIFVGPEAAKAILAAIEAERRSPS